MSAEYSVDAKEYLDNCVNALDHIARTARNCRVTSKRLTWIASRAESAINSNDAWRDAPVPVNGTSALLRAQARIKELEAALAAQGQGEALSLPDDGAYIIRYEDTDQPDEIIACSGAREASARRFKQISGNWNAHLFVKIASNFRGCEIPDAHTQTAPPASPAGVPDLVRFAIERCLRSQEALVASIDKANPDDPYASLLVADDIEYLRAWIAASSATPEGGEVGL